MSTRTPAQAIAWANAATNGEDYKSKCLVFVRNCYNVAAKYETAALAWKGASKKHATTSTAGIPAGAPVFFSTAAAAGHVALYLGSGKFRTNYTAKGTIVTTEFGTGALSGMTMLGWTEDLNGVTLGLSSSSSVTLKKGSTGTAVKTLQSELNRLFPAYSSLATDGDYGDKTVAVVKEFQRRAGVTVDGVVGSETRTALAKYGAKL